MLYGVLRAAADVALHWYYGDVLVQGREHVPAHGPLLIVANHPNALVDAMLVTTTLSRRVLITAKATLFEHPLLAPLFHAIGVVPLRRVQDQSGATELNSGRARNAGTFHLVTDALRREGVVLVFPEGISHDAPALAPIKTGASRMALEARSAGVHGVRIVPMGLVYEEKERLRSRILVRVGDSVDVDRWCEAHGEESVAALTTEIDARLRRVTLNFASAERASRAVLVARALAATIHAPPPLGQPRLLAIETAIAARVECAMAALASAPLELIARADVLGARFATLEARLAARGATIDEARISARARHGLRFLVREASLFVAAAPIALLGRLAHWLPLWIARRTALHSLANDPSRDQPAMRTIVVGLCTVVLWYMATATLVGHWLGPVAAVIWLGVLMIAARVDVLLGDRLRRVRDRARTYLAFRADPAFQATALDEMEALLDGARTLERALTPAPHHDHAASSPV